jgi:hypothetical protein
VLVGNTSKNYDVSPVDTLEKLKILKKIRKNNTKKKNFFDVLAGNTSKNFDVSPADKLEKLHGEAKPSWTPFLSLIFSLPWAILSLSLQLLRFSSSSKNFKFSSHRPATSLHHCPSLTSQHPAPSLRQPTATHLGRYLCILIYIFIF